MKNWIFLLLIPALFACKAIKTVKIFNAGEVTEKEFKTEIPFEYRLGLIILKVKIEGETYDFVLDTGAPNVISTELAAKLKVTSKVNQKTKDSQGGKSELGFTTIPDIEIGGIHFTNTGTAVADLKQSTEIACLKIDGFVGANLMKKAIWQFDYKNKMITITHSKSSLEIPSTSKTIPFKQQLTGTPLIDIDYHGIVNKNVTFDLGSNGGFASTETIFNKLKETGKVTETTQGFGNNNSGLFGQKEGDTTHYALVPEVKFGDLVLTNQIVSFHKAKAQTIGTEFFKSFKLIIDWGKEEITLIPVDEFKNSELKTFGFSPKFADNKLVVGFIYDQSLAALQGIQVGDQILEINGIDYRTFDAEKWCEVISKGLFPSNEDTFSILLLKDNQERQYTLKREVLLKSK